VVVDAPPRFLFTDKGWAGVPGGFGEEWVLCDGSVRPPVRFDRGESRIGAIRAAARGVPKAAVSWSMVERVLCRSCFRDCPGWTANARSVSAGSLSWCSARTFPATLLTITLIMFAEPEAAGRSERRMSERPPRQDAEGVRPAAGGEGHMSHLQI